MGFTIINPPRVYPQRRDYQTVKRMVDLVICITFSPFIIALILVCALAIYVDSGKPIIFVQKRIGKGGLPFRLYKFRTLKPSYHGNHFESFMKSYIRGDISTYSTENKTFKPMSNHHVTRVGQFLRRTSLDEFPQILNVLKGEMSIVGPRPNVPWEVTEYKPWHYERLEVLPGITGLAQVNGRSCLSFDSLVRYDIKYIENQSLSFDIKIILQTFGSVIKSKSAG